MNSALSRFVLCFNISFLSAKFGEKRCAKIEANAHHLGVICDIAQIAIY